MSQISRRNILQYFGVGASALIYPFRQVMGSPTTPVKKPVPDNVLHFKKFEEWIRALSESVRTNKINSFVITKNKKDGIFSVAGKFDNFALDQIGKEIAYDIYFDIDIKSLPEGFVNQFSDKHGRMLLTHWLREDKFQKHSVSIFVEECNKSRLDHKTKEHQERYEPGKWVDKEHIVMSDEEIKKITKKPKTPFGFKGRSKNNPSKLHLEVSGEADIKKNCSKIDTDCATRFGESSSPAWKEIQDQIDKNGISDVQITSGIFNMKEKFVQDPVKMLSQTELRDLLYGNDI